MIVTIKADIDNMSKIGAIVPQFDGAWSTRYPMFNGGYMIGSYRVPQNKKFKLQSISAHAEYKNIQMTNALGGFALGTMFLKVDGVTKMEYLLQWAGGTFNAVTSDTGFGYNWRAIGNFKNLPFSAGTVITLEITPIVSAGLVPQVRYTGQFLWKLSTGQKDIYKFESILTTGVANQQIASYTVPSGGVTLQHFGVEGISTDFMMGVVQVRLDGANIFSIPMFSSAMMTRPIPLTMPFIGGLTLGEGQEITVYGDFTHALNQTVQVLIFGEEIAYASGSPNYAYIGN